jgi:hypothetical protein
MVGDSGAEKPCLMADVPHVFLLMSAMERNALCPQMAACGLIADGRSSTEAV